MSLFEKVDKVQSEALEEAMRCLGERQKFSFVYDTKIDSLRKPIRRQAHVIPCEQVEGKVQGLFLFDNADAYRAPIGFKQTRGLFPTVYYHFKEDTLVTSAHREQYLYIPLQVTDLGQFEGTDEEYYATKRGFLEVLGIQREETIPLVLLFETDEGIDYWDLARTSSGNISLYSHWRGKPKPYEIKSLLQRVQKEEVRKQESAVVMKKGVAFFKSVEKEREWSEPSSLVQYFDQDVIGQERAKEMVAGSVALHLHRMRKKNDDLKKGNVLLIGDSGTGKTHLVRTLATLLQERAPAIKYAETSVPGKSSAGYVNENFASFLEGLRDPKEEAPYGIIFVDEIDKTVNTDDSAKGFFEERIQRELIGMLEDALYRGDESKKVASLRTRNLLFIAAGAFQGLEDVIKRRIGGAKRIGFGQQAAQDEISVLRHVTSEDLVRYGLKAELVGRFSHVAVLNPLTANQKVSIFTDTRKSPLKTYVSYFAEKEYQFIVSDKACASIVDRCASITGARSIDQICGTLFAPILMNPSAYAKGNTILITEEFVRGEEERKSEGREA